ANLVAQHVHDFAQVAARPVHHAEFVKRPSAAKRPAGNLDPIAARGEHARGGYLDPIAARGEHARGGSRHVGMKIIVEVSGQRITRGPLPTGSKSRVNERSAKAGTLRCGAMPSARFTMTRLPMRFAVRGAWVPRRDQRSMSPKAYVAMSTFTGHSPLQPLHERHRSSASFTALCFQPPFRTSPVSASKSSRARPRVECISSMVTL